MRRPVTAALVLGILGWIPGGVRASPRVRVLSAEETPGFVQALRIQLAGTAEVDPGPRVRGDGPATRLEQARADVAQSRAVLGTWLERDGSFVVLYLVGPHQDRALVDVQRIPAEVSPDFDRMLALKVRDVLDQLVAAAEVEVSLPGSMLAEPKNPPPRRLAAGAWWFAAGVRVTGSSGDNGMRPGLSLQLGRSWAGPIRVSPVIGLDVPTEANLVETAQGSARANEWAPRVGIQATSSGPTFRWGGALHTHLRIVLGRGVSPGGREGRETAYVPSMSLAGKADLRLFGPLWLTSALGAEMAWVRQRFLINDAPLADLGRFRVFGELAIALQTP